MLKKLISYWLKTTFWKKFKIVLFRRISAPLLETIKTLLQHVNYLYILGGYLLLLSDISFMKFNE